MSRPSFPKLLPSLGPLPCLLQDTAFKVSPQALDDHTVSVELDTLKCFASDRDETLLRIDTTEARFPTVVDGLC
jgi:hypothetical protein